MKKLLIVFSSIIVIGLSFVSCSSDNEDNNPLVGTEWYSENIGSYLYSQTSGGDYQLIWKFTSNNTYDEYYQEKNTGKIGDSGYKKNLPYVYNDSYIVVYSNDNKEAKWFFLSPSKLSNHEDPSESWTIFFYKK